MTYSINWPITVRSAVPFRKLYLPPSFDRRLASAVHVYAYYAWRHRNVCSTAPPMMLPIPNPKTNLNPNPKTYPNPNPIFNPNPNPFF